MDTAAGERVEAVAEEPGQRDREHRERVARRERQIVEARVAGGACAEQARAEEHERAHRVRRQRGHQQRRTKRCRERRVHAEQGARQLVVDAGGSNAGAGVPVASVVVCN